MPPIMTISKDGLGHKDNSLLNKLKYSYKALNIITFNSKVSIFRFSNAQYLKII